MFEFFYVAPIDTNIEKDMLMLKFELLTYLLLRIIITIKLPPFFLYSFNYNLDLCVRIN